MNVLSEYSIPISGLKNGLHSFDFQLDSGFFSHFPDSLIKEGNFKVRLNFDKRTDLYEMTFDYKGHFQTPCDRCLAAINLPIKGSNHLIIKFSDEFKEEAEIIYVPPRTQQLNVAKYLYEFICLSIPLIKAYNCEEEEKKPCDKKMLAYLVQENEEREDAPSKSNPLWDQLKDVKFN